MASENDIEEERRLCYVAMTRAEKGLQLSFATTRMRNGKHESNSPSRFLREIDSRYISNPLGQGDEDEPAGPALSWQRSRRPFASSGYAARPQVGRQGMSSSSYGRSGDVTVIPSPASRKPAVSVPPRPGAEFEPTPILQLKAGQRVEHNRFGFGKIIEITGGPSDLKARIAFDSYGEKILLLKYAKIRTVEK